MVSDLTCACLARLHFITMKIDRTRSERKLRLASKTVQYVYLQEKSQKELKTLPPIKYIDISSPPFDGFFVRNPYVHYHINMQNTSAQFCWHFGRIHMHAANLMKGEKALCICIRDIESIIARCVSYIYIYTLLAFLRRICAVLVCSAQFAPFIFLTSDST